MRKLAVLIAITLFFVPFFWFEPGEVNLGGDSSRLYFYDPLNYLRNFSLYSVIPSDRGAENISYFFAPFVILFVFLKAIIASPHFLIAFFDGFMLASAFYFTYLSIYNLLEGDINGRKMIVIVAILGGLFYSLTPVIGYNWDKATARHNQFFLNPLLFFLLFRFFYSQKIHYALIALLITVVFAVNFSFVTAANVLAFFPFAIFYLFFYITYIKGLSFPWKKVFLLLPLFLGAHAFHLLPQILALFDRSSSEFYRIFSPQGINEALIYFEGASRGIRLTNNIIAIPQTELFYNFDYIFFIFPLFLIVGLLFNSSRKKLSAQRNFILLFSFFLVILFLATANITSLGFLFYKLLFKLPGFGAFRNYFGQFLYIFYFFYAILFAYACYYTLSFFKGSRKYLIFGLVSLLLVIYGWPFIKGDMVHLPIYQSKDIAVPFKMDPEFERMLKQIREDKTDGKYLTLPLADFGYQLVAGKEGGVYIGPSMISYLGGKQDFSGYTAFSPFADLFLKLAKEKDIESLKNFLAMYNIRYVFYNEDHYIYDNFPKFPYEQTRTSFPSFDVYRGLLKSLAVQEVFSQDVYHVYKLSDSDYLPHIYIAKNKLGIQKVEDLEYLLPFYSFSKSAMAVEVLKEGDSVLRPKKVDIYKRITKDYPVPVRYPFARWKLDSPVYPLIVLKENYILSKIDKLSDEYLDYKLFYAAKRITELARWEGGIPILGGLINHERLLRHWEPTVFEFMQWYKYNSWETSLSRYTKHVDEVVHKILDSEKDLAWKMEKKSEVKQVLLDHWLQLVLMIKHSEKSELQKQYLLALIDDVFSYYLEKLAVPSFDPSVVEYTVHKPTAEPALYEVYIKRDAEKEIDFRKVILRADDQILSPPIEDRKTKEDLGVKFGTIRLPNKDTLVALTIPPSENLAAHSFWEKAQSIAIATDSAGGVTTLKSFMLDKKPFEGFVSYVRGLKAKTHYLLSFDYRMFGDNFEITILLSGSQLFKEVKNATDWRGFNIVISTDDPADVILQIKPIESAAKPTKVDIKNFSVFKLPPHPDMFFKKIDENINNIPEKKVPSMVFTKINPTKYKLAVRGATDPYTLVFSEAFNNKWELIDVEREGKTAAERTEGLFGNMASSIVGLFGVHKNVFFDSKTFETWGKQSVANERHVLMNGYANAWHIIPQDMEDKIDYELILEMRSQRAFYTSLFLSLVALIVVLGLLAKSVAHRI